MVIAENANKGSQQPVVKTGFVAYVFGLPIFEAQRASILLQICLTEGLAESVVGADGAPRAFILKLGYFGLIL